MSTEKDSLKIQQAAQLKVMDLLAVRTHTEKELRQKLATHFSAEEFVDEIVEEAIGFAREKKYLEDPDTLAQRWAETLHRRNKGIEFINSYLEQKGLPSVPMNSQQEYEKALLVIKEKYNDDHKFSEEEKGRIGRMLTSRGFDSETVRKVLHEKL